MAKRKKVKKRTKKAKKKAKKKSLKQHAKEFHAIGKKYTKNAMKISVLHRRERAQKEIKKQIAKLEKSLKKIAKLAGRM
jgi:hypothetical protein